jgi:serine/threonine-protein kinase
VPLSSLAERKVLGGRYELLGLTGVGRMGSVYRARDRELDEFVALKVLGASSSIRPASSSASSKR